jgi:argininosuccinate lyase
MMPQKRNPDLCELIRGKSATVLGHYVAAMTLIKGLPMGYMKDLQEDKNHLFQVVDTVQDVLDALPILLSSIQVHTSTLEKACADTQLLATDLMEFLVVKGVPLRQAHHQVAKWIDQSDHYLHSARLEHEDLPPLNAKASCEKRFLKIRNSYRENNQNEN